VFGVLKIVLRGDRVAACVSVARQLKVFFRYMQRRAANSDVTTVGVIRTRQGVGLTMAICLAVAKSVIVTKCHFLSLLFPRLLGDRRSFCRVETFEALATPSRQASKKRPDARAERLVSDHEASDSVCRFRAGFRLKRAA